MPLERALTLAEPEGYVRVFADEGATDGRPAESGRETRDRPGLCPPAAGRRRRRPRTRAPGSQGLIEPLSERELDVLRLLGTDLDGPDIARELVVSLNTVRTHTKNIYAKLGVNSRRAAVRRARGARPVVADPRPLTAAPTE